MRKLATSILIAVLALILIVMPAGCDERDREVIGEVVIGNGDSTEQRIVGELMKQLLEDHGFEVDLVSGLSSVALRERMVAGNIDICADYTGLVWIVHLANKWQPGTSNNEIYRLLKHEDFNKGVVWLSPIWNSNTYALASRPEFVIENNLKTLSDLASLYREKEGKIKTSMCYEFCVREDGLPALKKYYNIEIAESWLQIEPSPGISGLSLKENECDVAMVFATDAMVAEYGWYVYVDDKAFFPPYDLTPCIRREVLDKYAEIAGILNRLACTFPGGGEPATPETVARCQKVWQELNRKVDMDEVPPDEVAHEYLVKHGLVRE